MTVTVEDGTIIAGANSYAALVTADAYHEEMGNTAWDGFSDELKDAGLIRGTLMIESRYRGRWIGYKTNNSATAIVQLLAWPRRKLKSEDPTTDITLTPLEDQDGIDIGINDIPLVVQYACMEAAFMHASGSALVPDKVTRSKYVTKTRVDVIEQTFSDKTPAIDRFPLIDQLLQDVAIAGGVNLTAAIGLTQAELDAISGTDALEEYLATLGSGAGGGG
jgi:hypothetical protein